MCTRYRHCRNAYLYRYYFEKTKSFKPHSFSFVVGVVVVIFIYYLAVYLESIESEDWNYR